MTKEYEANRIESNWTRCLLKAVDDSHIPYSAEANGDFGRAELHVDYPGYRPAVIKIREKGSQMTAETVTVEGEKSTRIVKTYADLVSVIDSTIPAKAMAFDDDDEDEW